MYGSRVRAELGVHGAAARFRLLGGPRNADEETRNIFWYFWKPFAGAGFRSLVPLSYNTSFSRRFVICFLIVSPCTTSHVYRYTRYNEQWAHDDCIIIIIIVNAVNMQPFRRLRAFVQYNIITLFCCVVFVTRKYESSRFRFPPTNRKLIVHNVSVP